MKKTTIPKKTYKQRDKDVAQGKVQYRIRKQLETESKKELKEFKDATQTI